MREVTGDRVLGLAVSWSRVWGRNCYGGWHRVGAGDGDGIVNWIAGRRNRTGTWRMAAAAAAQYE